MSATEKIVRRPGGNDKSSVNSSKAASKAKTAAPTLRKPSKETAYKGTTGQPASKSPTKKLPTTKPTLLASNGTTSKPSTSASASKSQTSRAAAGRASEKAGTESNKKDGAKGKIAVKVLALSPDTEHARSESADDFPVPAVEYVKPANQVQLTEAESAEEHARLLNAARPGPHRVIVRYNLEDRSYKPEPQLDQALVHYTAEGSLLYRDGDEGQNLVKAHAAEDERGAAVESQTEADTEAGKSKRLRNQFNFSERGVQTTTYAPRDEATATDVPKLEEASGTCSQWEIYDAYAADQKQQRQQEEASRQKAPSKVLRSEEAPAEDLDAGEPRNVMESESLRKALCLVQRMETQNNLQQVTLDFKYWDDEADAVKLEEGTLLPLWKFTTSLAGQKQVTALSWSSAHPDLFVVAFGSFDFQRQTAGFVAGFSLKNSAHPEFYLNCKSGAMSVQLNPQTPNLLAVGCYDGSVAVYDVRQKHNSQPVYSSTPKSRQHWRPVWSVEWTANQPGTPAAFHSLSSDGRVLLWTLAIAELTCQEVLTLTAGVKLQSLPDQDPSQPVLAAGCCIDFHPVSDFIAVIGTEEGAIYKCNTAHRTGFLMAYEGHGMAVYAVRWNRVHPITFLTSSADWSVKLWHTDHAQAVMTFGMGSPVGHIGWYPGSATIFAAVTEDGLARVFDLRQNTAEPLCEQRIVAKAALTRLAFNPKYPVLLVGDDRSQVAVLKLSPNLRKLAKADTGAARIQAEQSRLDAVLAIAKIRQEAIEAAMARAPA